MTLQDKMQKQSINTIFLRPSGFYSQAIGCLMFFSLTILFADMYSAMTNQSYYDTTFSDFFGYMGFVFLLGGVSGYILAKYISLKTESHTKFLQITDRHISNIAFIIAGGLFFLSTVWQAFDVQHSSMSFLAYILLIFPLPMSVIAYFAIRRLIKQHLLEWAYYYNS